ncbi:hypothetical protein J1614_005808 [Plenodomus biglobosus]|nr:hypothetical protein J1614_005808 [Plenodomus biglobosus]
MSAAKHETNRPPVDHDVEIRMRNFGNFTIAALRKFAILVLLVRTLLLCVKAVPSTMPMPYPLRWACIVSLYLSIIARYARPFQFIIAMTRIHMSEIEDKKCSSNQGFGTRTTNLEDWILANFCVIVGMLTTDFVARYWIEVIALTLRSFFYWSCTMVCLCSLFWLLKWTIPFTGKSRESNMRRHGVPYLASSFYDPMTNSKGLRLKVCLGTFLPLVAFRSTY